MFLILFPESSIWVYHENTQTFVSGDRMNEKSCFLVSYPLNISSNNLGESMRSMALLIFSLISTNLSELELASEYVFSSFVNRLSNSWVISFPSEYWGVLFLLEQPTASNAVMQNKSKAYGVSFILWGCNGGI